MSSTVLTLTNTLANDPRTNLEVWLEEVETVDRSLCAQYDMSGNLILVASDIVWSQYPDNTTNMTDVINNGDPPNNRLTSRFAVLINHFFLDQPISGIRGANFSSCLLLFFLPWLYLWHLDSR